jgi:hypothetical protein
LYSLRLQPWRPSWLRGNQNRQPARISRRRWRAGHYDFLPPCGPRLAVMAAQMCADPSDFNRAEFHEWFNAEVTRFFQTSQS